MLDTNQKKVIIVGAGPAGLTAAWELCKEAVPSVVIEKDSVVGGISRTVRHKGYHFDIGGHRFFTKVSAVDRMWREVLNDKEFLRRKRISRIYYRKKFFHYPIKAANALRGLGLWNSFLILLSYARVQMFPQKPEVTFEQWVSNRFGRRLYRIFFKTYTEKVWGIPCDQITAEWAAQRIKGLSLLTAVRNALLSEARTGDEVITTLIDSFDYPARGPGMMWERVCELIQKRNSSVLMETEVSRILWTAGSVKGIEVQSKDKQACVIDGTHFISSMPMRELIQKFDPAAPASVLAAAEKLNYRDFLTVALIIDHPNLFEDNWIYIHDPDAKVGRIQNFKNWSPHMVPDETKTCLGLEYFCFEGDGLWSMLDADLIALAKKELADLGLANASDIIDGAVVRMPKAYPVYDSTYADALTVVREFLADIENLYLVGRNGMHKYNNQDHSMLTAMLSVRNILGAKHDIWGVNADREYHEEIRRHPDQSVSDDELELLSITQPEVPQRRKHVP